MPPADAAEAYPTRPILVVVPAPADGALDIAFRIIRPALSADLGMPMAIENKAGASGTIGMVTVAIAKPDGYTLAATSTSTLTFIRASSPSVPYKLDDFVPIGNYALDFTTLVVRADARWTNLDELNSYARRHPGELSYGSAGTATLSALNMESIKAAFGLDIVQVPYPGAGQVANALLGRHLELGAIPLSSVALPLREGALRVVATTAAHPPVSFPGIPTLAEAGDARAWPALAIGLYAPARTPPSVIDRLSSALRRAARAAPVVAALEAGGLRAQYENGGHVRARLAAEQQQVPGLARGPTPDGAAAGGR